MFSKVHQGFTQLLELGLAEGTQPRLYGGQAEGCAPVASAFAEDRKVTPLRPDTVARSLAIGNPADGDLAVATARASGGAIHAVAEDEVGENMALLAETSGVFGETAAGVTLGALREAVRAGAVGERDTVVLLVTGDGLKTPQAVAGRVRPQEVEADADTLLERVSSAASDRTVSTLYFLKKRR
jgi:threonine synthase